ncbi:contact-dependent growth inhibition system immunity protein [Streptomyces sp. NPDC020096]
MTQPNIFAPDAEWLPELRHLLQAYRSVPVPAEECFVDSEEAPSRGMRSYLRVAVYYPGRAFRAAREIADVVHLGINHYDVAACLATMPPIIPPRGKVRVDCLLAMIPYLAEFENGGYREEPAPPDTAWECRERYPNLGMLLAAHFSQDDSLERTARLDAYFEHNPDFRIAAALRELEEAREICPTEAELKNATSGLGMDAPPPDGQPYTEWLDHLAHCLAARLESVSYERPHGLNPAYPAHDIRTTW